MEKLIKKKEYPEQFFRIENYKKYIEENEKGEIWELYLRDYELYRNENKSKNKLINHGFPISSIEIKLIQEMYSKNQNIIEIEYFFQRSRITIQKILDGNVNPSYKSRSKSVKHREKIDSKLDVINESQRDRRYKFLNISELKAIINNLYTDYQKEIDEEISLREETEKKILINELEKIRSGGNEIKPVNKVGNIVEQNSEDNAVQPNQVTLPKTPSNSLNETLKNVFGYTKFRSGQLEIIENIINKRNTLAIMPTGAGKSLCYQLPAIISKKNTIVISPLISLIEDQVASLKQVRIAVSMLHSNQSQKENQSELNEFISGKNKLLYISPERLMAKDMLSMLSKVDIGLIVIDEVHCVSKWGQSFRPDYEKLSILKDHFTDSVIAGFTATADKTTRVDILEKIFGKKADIYVKGFDRPNLSLNVAQKINWKSQLLKFLNMHKGQAGIIYCLSRKSTEEVSLFLNNNNYNTSAYHAGLDAETRRNIQNEFMTYEGKIIVATIAFGMGIDKPDVRFVVHLNLPGSMESYYQEIGRAGRDGKPADTLLIYGLDDLVIRRRMIENDNSPEEFKLKENKRLDYLISYCETPNCRRNTLLNYFDDSTEKCDNCDNCRSPASLIDGTDIAYQLLEAIYQTGEYFGQTHVINVLRGSVEKKIIERRHHELSVHGAGADKSAIFWRNILRQLLASNHIRINFQKFGAVEITQSGRNIHNKSKKFFYKETKNDNAEEVVSLNDHSKIKSNKIDIQNNELFLKLKKIRLHLATQEQLPPYIIFHDSTLVNMSNKLPQTEEDLLKIDGVGSVKLKRYGGHFLEVIKNHILS